MAIPYPWNILMLFDTRDIITMANICECGKGNKHFKVIQMPSNGEKILKTECVVCKLERICTIDNINEIITKTRLKYKRVKGTNRFINTKPDIYNKRLPGSFESKKR